MWEAKIGLLRRHGYTGSQQAGCGVQGRLIKFLRGTAKTAAWSLCPPKSSRHMEIFGRRAMTAVHGPWIKDNGDGALEYRATERKTRRQESRRMKINCLRSVKASWQVKTYTHCLPPPSPEWKHSLWYFFPKKTAQFVLKAQSQPTVIHSLIM